MEQQHRVELERREKDLTAHFHRVMPPPLSSPDHQGQRRDQFCQDARYEHTQFYDQSSPHFRRSYESPGSTVDAKLKLKKAFKEIRDAPNAEKYESRSGQKLYSSWKEALKREVGDLELEPSQWLDLLKVRTKGKANQIVQDAWDMSLETSPEIALEKAWKYMDKAFHTTTKASQWIFSNVLTGSDITLTDVDGLETFARLCDEALCFMETSPGTFLSFNEQMTQERIFERLDPELSRKWFEFRVERRLPEGAVSFKVFSEWINAQSSIELARIGSDRKDRRPQTSLTTQKEKTETAYQPPHRGGKSFAFTVLDLGGVSTLPIPRA